MKIDFTRLLLVMVGFLIAQYVIQYALIAIGITGIPLIVLYNLLLAFFATFIYYPRSERMNAFKNPNFYRDVGSFFLVFLIISLVFGG